MIAGVLGVLRKSEMMVRSVPWGYGGLQRASCGVFGKERVAGGVE